MKPKNVEMLRNFYNFSLNVTKIKIKILVD
jgi:hypothetical protein